MILHEGMAKEFRLQSPWSNIIRFSGMFYFSVTCWYKREYINMAGNKVLDHSLLFRRLDRALGCQQLIPTPACCLYNEFHYLALMSMYELFRM